MEGIPDGFEFQALPEDWDQFEIFMNTGSSAFPPSPRLKFGNCSSDPSFTPDNRYILGEAPILRKLYIAAGFNSIGINRPAVRERPWRNG